jgi:hypothetical protein
MTMKRTWFYITTMVCLVAMLSLGIPRDAFANPDDVQIIYDNIKKLQHTADDGTPSATTGSSSGNNVLKDVSSVSICGTDISKGQVKNLQATGGGFQVVRVNTLDDFIQLMGESYRDDITDSFADAEGWQDANGNTYALHKTMSLCGQTFELDVYDVKPTNYDYTDVTIKVVDISQWDSDTPISNYQDSSAACFKNADGSNAPPLAENGTGTTPDGYTHSFTVKQQVTSLPYTFGCAGHYRVTYVDHYTDGSTSKPKYQDVTVPREKIPRDNLPPFTKSSSGSLIITK